MTRDLFDILCDLQHRLAHPTGPISSDILERYHYFITHSEHGKNCGYAVKYAELFSSHDLDPVCKLILEAANYLNSGLPPIQKETNDKDEET